MDVFEGANHSFMQILLGGVELLELSIAGAIGLPYAQRTPMKKGAELCAKTHGHPPPAGAPRSTNALLGLGTRPRSPTPQDQQTAPGP